MDKVEMRFIASKMRKKIFLDFLNDFFRILSRKATKKKKR